MERVRGVIAEIEPFDSPERFRGLGVDVVFGEGRFTGPDAFEVGGRTLTARTFVIATGSRPAVPPIPGLADVPYLTNETVFDLREPVPSLRRRRRRPHRLRARAGVPAPGQRRHGGRHGARASCRARMPTSRRSCAASMAADGVRFHFDASIVRVAGTRRRDSR